MRSSEKFVVIKHGLYAYLNIYCSPPFSLYPNPPFPPAPTHAV